ncbi:MAG TPA: DUF3630 family protein [Nitrospiraceae bacterium]|nr:DUF3630 family protein [Nitrospiraceae bacterium]
MASGDLSLLITEDVSWESFPDQAQKFVERFDGKVIDRIDTPVERMWAVTIKACEFWLVFEDFPLGMSLDSKSSSCNPVIQEIYSALVGKGTWQAG